MHARGPLEQRRRELAPRVLRTVKHYMHDCVYRVGAAREQ